MVSAPNRPARARSAAEKTQRRDDILRAAERLWNTSTYTDLSMNHVAREAQLAKGTLYLYFDTKEELFLALVSEHLQTWINDTIRLLQERRPVTPAAVADALLDASSDVVPLRRLMLLLGTVLERNVRPELTRDFRRDVTARVQMLISHLPFSDTMSLKILRHLYALAIGWQHLAEEFTTSATDAVAAPGPDPYAADFELAMRAVIDRLAAQDTARR
ncbi:MULTISPECIES: TetR/AcrR family transcriptional regulator [Deinococcus]|uniref:TetR/AcrR family transcriptional regulator n=1 Tax=Deinococcus rufus TaxID=2136097 RepID=A0ABV7ZF58_9DEIO|nr:TetR/AcrR family transcriptional regulator [Deinococcus sp. AB2017081]WQE93585.1 TetR family transcriptional regulator [Deinococcus sp. AB2017081]